jgi:hypothetical protein
MKLKSSGSTEVLEITVGKAITFETGTGSNLGKAKAVNVDLV